jgi:hypothetical protein
MRNRPVASQLHPTTKAPAADRPLRHFVTGAGGKTNLSMLLTYT